MKYPNLRYGNPNEFNYYTQGMPVQHVAKRLRRSERSVKDWQSGAQKMPWWIPELLRLQSMESAHRAYQMNMGRVTAKLGLAASSVLNFPTVARRRPLAVNDAHYHGQPPPMRAAA